MEVFLHPSILQTDCSKFLLKDNFGPDSGSRPQMISAPPAPAPAQHCLIKCIFKIKEQDLDSMVLCARIRICIKIILVRKIG